MEEIEIWKSLDFVGYPDYEVSNMGQIRSLDRIIITSDGRTYKFKGRILKPTKDKDGYLQISIRKDKKEKKIKAHRLIAFAFIPNPNNLPQINHKNEIKDDNRVENLEWCDNYYNSHYGTKLQRQREKMKGFKHTEESKQKMSNSTKGENNPMYGKTHTDEVRKKISEAHKGKPKLKLRGIPKSEETKQKISEANSKPILQYTKDMVFIREWQSTTQASKELNIHQSSINKVCLNKQKTAGGCIWRYKSM